jgi:fumarate reductase subunit C
MSGRRPYTRSMSGWWKRDPFFTAYMVREATSFIVAAYAIVLLVGLVRLGQGKEAYDGFMQALQSPISVVFHLVALAVFVYHTWSWFKIMPKTMPMIFISGKRLEGDTITRTGVVVAVVVTIVFLAFVMGVTR